MKYNTDVDNEKRNKSPRNDLLRNRKCVDIIQAAKAHTHGHVSVFTMTTGSTMCPDAGSSGARTGWILNEPSGAERVGLRRQQRGTRRLGSPCFRGRSMTGKRTSGIQSKHPKSIPETQGLALS